MENTEYGYLKVISRAAESAYPIPGARVTVTSGDQTLVYHLMTDRSGSTEKLELPAAPRSRSLLPGSEEPVAFVYQITTEKDGYYTVSDINVPIYSGVTSIQPVNMIPVAAGSESEKPYPIADTRYDENQPPNL